MPRWLLRTADRRPGLSILLFHRVLAERDPFRPGDLTASEFDRIIALLARSFVVLPLDEPQPPKNSAQTKQYSVTTVGSSVASGKWRIRFIPVTLAAEVPVWLSRSGKSGRAIRSDARHDFPGDDAIASRR